MLNRIVLAGRLVADPEFKTTPSGVAVVSCRLACDRDFKDKETGERATDFINIVAWRATAEFISRYFTKGRAMVVDGRLQVRQYTDRDGAKRSATEVVAEHVYFGDSAPAETGQGYGGYSARRAPDVTADGFDELDDDDGELPFK